MATSRQKPGRRGGGTDAGTALLTAVLGKAGLDALAGNVITGDEVEFHDSPKIVLPRQMTYGKAYEILERLEEEAEMPTDFSRRFMYRPDDGAHAFLQVAKARYGMIMGKQTATMFGMLPAENRDIAIGVGKRIQVPWGRTEIPIFEKTDVVLTEHMDRDYGKIFAINATGPKKYKDEIEEFFDAIEAYLTSGGSLYRGKAIIGSDDPEFLDLTSFKPEQVIFSTDVQDQLDGILHSPLRNTERFRREGVPLKRAVLLEGPYGTGKTSEGQIAAGIATDNGWTFISARPGRDKVEDVLRTARLYQPALVFVEDIDGSTSQGDDDDVTKMLDAFDGITAKGGELMIAMTTNHVERIHKGMLRPGRLDGVIHIAELDAAGIEKLIKVVTPKGKLAEDIDYKQVTDAMEGFLPAFVRETITRSVSYAIDRTTGGKGDYTIDTEDLVHAANGLRPQLDLQDAASEGKKRPSLEKLYAGIVDSRLQQHQVMLDANRPLYIEAVPEDVAAMRDAARA